MFYSFSKLLIFLDSNLGRCPTCTQTAFLSAIASWVIIVATNYFWPNALVLNLLFLIAIALTSLWLLHLAIYTIRILKLLRLEYFSTAERLEADANQMPTNRRNILSICATALSISVIASVWLPTSTFARGRKCGSGYCPDSTPNCCSRSREKFCDGNWACTKTRSCHATHKSARKSCGQKGVVWSCG